MAKYRIFQIHVIEQGREHRQSLSWPGKGVPPSYHTECKNLILWLCSSSNVWYQPMVKMRWNGVKGGPAKRPVSSPTSNGECQLVMGIKKSNASNKYWHTAKNYQQRNYCDLCKIHEHNDESNITALELDMLFSYHWRANIFILGRKESGQLLIIVWIIVMITRPLTPQNQLDWS